MKISSWLIFIIQLKQEVFEISYMCTNCLKEFPTSDDLRCHREESHLEYKLANNTISIDYRNHFLEVKNDNNSNDVDEDDTFKSSSCGETYHTEISPELSVSKTNLELSSLVFPCKHCSKTFITKEKLQRHQRAHRTKVFFCDLCPAKFHSAYMLRNHKEGKHATERNHLCDICNKSFKQVKDLKLHMVVHTKEHRYKCDLCDNGYKSQKKLDTHKKTVHEDFRFICEVCQKIFKSEASFKGHKKTHDPNHVDKIWSCDLCPKGFKKRRSLQRHKRIHDGTLEKDVCEVCGKSYASENFLKVHMRTHTGQKSHVCEVCGKAFAVKSCLNEHMRVHTKEKPFICSFCGKGFSQKGSLNIHIRTHTNEKPYKCDICEKAFISGALLKTHTCKK